MGHLGHDTNNPVVTAMQLGKQGHAEERLDAEGIAINYHNMSFHGC